MGCREYSDTFTGGRPSGICRALYGIFPCIAVISDVIRRDTCAGSHVGKTVCISITELVIYFLLHSGGLFCLLYELVYQLVVLYDNRSSALLMEVDTVGLLPPYNGIVWWQWFKWHLCCTLGFHWNIIGMEVLGGSSSLPVGWILFSYYFCVSLCRDCEVNRSMIYWSE